MLLPMSAYRFSDFGRHASAIAVSLCLACSAAFAQKGQLEINVVDRDTMAPVAVRMKLMNEKLKPVKVPKVPYLGDHFVFESKLVLELPLGNYTFEMERGPEYKVRYGSFQLERDAADNKQVDMPRFFDMKKAGWWSGDLHVQREARHIDLLMRAEDLYVCPVVTYANEKLPPPILPPAAGEKTLLNLESRRFANLLTGRDRRESGELLFLNLAQPLELASISGESPPAGTFLKLAREQGTGHVDIARPSSWDLPVWIASGLVQSVEVFGDHLWRDGKPPEMPGKKGESIRFNNATGPGRFGLDVYYQLLNCGLRLPPSAGSGSGLNNNPVGYNRMYVHCGEELTYEKWFENFRRGRVVVTNGPLLQPLVNGEYPGHVFQADEGKTVELSIALNLGTREKIEYLEIVQDGKSVMEVRLDEWAQNNGQLPPVLFTKSGWLLVRAVTENPTTLRGAITAPYYVEIGYEPTISKKSAQFFYDWVVERAMRLKDLPADQREEVMPWHRQARDYWQKLIDKANTE